MTPRSPSSGRTPVLALVTTHTRCPSALKWRTIDAQRFAPDAVEGG
jgi:hypothetical protein